MNGNYMFGDKSTCGQNMPKKVQQENIFVCTLNKGQWHNLLM